ncbi:hypothetical protein Tco_0172899 [Tanacetum coccineum]
MVDRDEGGGDDVDGSVVVASDGGDGEGGVEMMPAAGRRGLHHLLDKVVPAGTASGPNNSKHNNNYNKRCCAKIGNISRNNIPGIKFNKWEELMGELMR